MQQDIQPDRAETVIKRYIEQLKFHQTPESEWYKTYYPAFVSFETDAVHYTIYRKSNGTYSIVRNFEGGCSLSRKQVDSLQLDDLFEYLEPLYADVLRRSITFSEHQSVN